jgi:molybdate transport system substrate-binding protein
LKKSLPPPAPEPVVVFAASSLTNVLDAAAREHERLTGVKVLVNVGASNSQARQIVDGAPADVFCSADEAEMDVVERAGKIAPGTRVVLAFNRLVVVVPPSLLRSFGAAGPPRLRGIADLLDARFQRIAVGDPAAVPVGVYTREYLERAGLWTRIQPRLVPTMNVRAALAAVEAGNADAAFVYATDAPMAPHVAIAFEVPDDQLPPIVYPGAVATAGRNAAGGKRFLAFLEGAQGRAIFVRFGFTVPK